MEKIIKRRFGALAIVGVFVALFFLPGVIADAPTENDVPGSYIFDIDYNDDDPAAIFAVKHEDSAELFRIQENGNVGIGTTSPDRKLEILDASDPQLKLSTSDTYWTELQTTSDGHLYLNPSHNRVGIETDSPVSTLSVAGAVTVGTTWAYTRPGPQNGMIIEGNVGIGTYEPLTKLHVDGGGLLVTGTTGGTPISGTGTRLMWIPSKAAFRAGYALGCEWDDFQIGAYSIAMGYQPIASGTYSISLGPGYASGEKSVTIGYGNFATGSCSIAIGDNCNANGGISIAMGWDTTANGYGTIAMGGRTLTNGEYTIATGYQTSASGTASTAMGYSSSAGGLYGGNTAIGYHCSASGDWACTALGYFATASDSYSTAIGSDVTASGMGSTALGRFVTAGPADENMVLGKGAGPFNPLVNNIGESLMIGFNSDIPTLFVGPSSGVGTTGKVGIGTVSPDKLLHLGDDTNNINGEIRFESSDGDVIDLGITTNTQFYITGGNVGIGINNPQRPLHISDVIRLQPRSSEPSSPSEGDIYVNSSDHHIYVYLGGASPGWKQLDNP